MRIKMTATYTTPKKANSKTSVRNYTIGTIVELRTLEALDIVKAGKATIV